MSFIFIITAFLPIPGAILRRDSNFKIISIFELVRSSSASLVSLLLAYNSFGYYSLAYGQLVSMIILALLNIYYTKWRPVFCYDHILMKNCYNFAKWSVIRIQLDYISNHFDKFLVGKFLGTSQLGYYDKSVSTAAIPVQVFFNNIASVMFSAYSDHKNNYMKLQNYYDKSMSITSLLCYPVYLGLYVVAPYFVYSLLGSKWAPMIEPFQIVIVSFIFKTFVSNLAAFNISVGKYKSHTIVFTISLFIFVLLSIFLVNFGLKWLAFAFLFYNCIYFIFDLFVLKSILNSSMKIILKPFLCSCYSVIFMLLVLNFASYYFCEYSFFNMIFLVVIGIISYIFAFYFDSSYNMKYLKCKLYDDFIKIKSSFF